MKNNNVSNNYIGIAVINRGSTEDYLTYNNTIENNTIFNNSIPKVNGSDDTLRGGILIGGILNGTSNDTLKNNSLIDNEIGIRIKNSNDLTITENSVVSSNTYGLLLINSSNCDINNNYIYGCAGNGSSGEVFGIGIIMVESSNNNISSNNVSENWNGIFLIDSSQNILDNNIANNNIYAPVASDVGPPNTGFYLENSSDNTFIKNTANNNNYGMFLSNSDYNTLINNTANNNTGIEGDEIYLSGGILLTDSSQNTLSGNTASNNDYGVYLISFSSNILYHNNLVDNTVDNAYDTSGNNQWDNAYPSGGNYWSDYSGGDQFTGPNQNLLGSDGIGDVPYDITGSGAQDEYPLMEPWNEQNKIQIGVLVDLSSWLSDYGIDVKKVIEIARDDVNNYLIATNEPYRVELFIEDTQASPSEALNKTQFLYNNGVRQIIGPLGTQEFIYILDFTNSSKIILASPSSTGPPQWLGITDPEERIYSFRFTPNDLFEAKAIAKVTESIGIKAVVILYIDNPWGSGLNESVVSELEGYNIEVNEIVKYPDQVPTDYTPYITSLENAVQSLGNQYNDSEIAVIAIDFGELSNILEQVPYGSVLLKSTWIGGETVIYQSMPCDKVNSVNLYSPIFESKGEGYEELNETFYNLYGTTPKGYSLNAYDALWILALANVENKEFDPDKIAEKISLVSENYSTGHDARSVSGNITFDEFNDRISGNYSIYAIKDCNWVNIGSWNIDTDTIDIDVDHQPTIDPVHNINKGTNYTTIQAAIDDASPGDEIHVDSGTYYENVDITKQLTLRGVDTNGGVPKVDAGGSGNAITLNADGILLEGFTARNGDNGIKIISSNNILIGNNASNNNDIGLQLCYSNNNILSYNNATGNYHGIELSYSINNTLTSNNVFYNSESGIELGYSSNNTLIDNDVSHNNDSGIELEPFSNNNTLNRNNVINNSKFGIELDSSDNNMLSSNNVMNNNKFGISLYSSSFNTLNVNNAKDNKKIGIRLSTFSNNNILSGNNVSSNNQYGIYLYNSSNNNIYHNNIESNSNQAYDNTRNNYWDSGYPSGGNYWSDCIGTDNFSGSNQDQVGGDGIGDIPYNIGGGDGAQDRYPLMQPWNVGGNGFISIGSVNAPTNSTITIPVSVANVTNISGISFDLLYNSSVVIVSSISANESFVGSSSSITSNIDNANGTTGILLTNSNLISASSETPVIDIAFNITGGSGSSTSLDLQNVEFSGSELNPYTPAVVVDGMIKVGIKGDFNGNGRVDIGDVAKVAFMVAGKVPEDLNADFNGNGRVDIGDAAKIAFYLAGKVSEL